MNILFVFPHLVGNATARVELFRYNLIQPEGWGEGPHGAGGRGVGQMEGHVAAVLAGVVAVLA